jgi:hypothetical protein
MSPAPSAIACAATPPAIASSCVALAARDVAVACWPICAIIVASWSTLSWSFVALLAAAFAATCCLLSSLAARLSRYVWSSDYVEGSVICPVKCSVRSLACFPLSGSNLSKRCRISGVSGIGSLPLMSRALEEAEDDPSLRMHQLRVRCFSRSIC